MCVTSITVLKQMEIMGLNSDSHKSKAIRAILRFKSYLKLVPWELVDGELALTTYCGDRIHTPYLIHELLELTQREEANLSECITLDRAHRRCDPNETEGD